MPEDTGESTESNQTNLEPEQAANAKDVLLALYQLECERAAHHQDQRAAGTNLILVFAGALVLVITYDGKLGFVDAVLGWALAVVGLLGAVMSYTGALHKSRLGSPPQTGQAGRGVFWSCCSFFVCIGFLLVVA